MYLTLHPRNSGKQLYKSDLALLQSFMLCGVQLHLFCPFSAQARLGRQGALFGPAGYLVDPPASEGASCLGPQGFRALHSIDGDLPAAAADGGGRFSGGRGGGGSNIKGAFEAAFFFGHFQLGELALSTGPWGLYR